MIFYLKKSQIDPLFFEIIQGERVVEEISIPFPLKRIPSSFGSLEQLKKWVKETEKKLALNYSLFCLARSSYSSEKLLKKLQKRGYSRLISQEIIDKMKREGFLNDDEFFERAILNEFAKGKGPRYIALKLGIEIEKVREKISPKMEKEKIQKILFKFSSKSREKIAAALFRRGFEKELIFESIMTRS